MEISSIDILCNYVWRKFYLINVKLTPEIPNFLRQVVNFINFYVNYCFAR